MPDNNNVESDGGDVNESVEDVVDATLSIENKSNDEDEEFFITNDMIKEEEHVKNENERERAAGLDVAPTLTKEERFQKLTHLLEKSKIYADFLLTVIDKKKEKEKKRALKREKKQKSLLEAAENGENNVQINTKRKNEESSSSQPAKRKRTSTLSKKLKNASNLPEEVNNKIYLPSPEDAVGIVEDRNGVRYFNDQLVPVSQPKLFCGGVLRDYQVTGYEWLKVLYENAVNGILADEMGLGKTIQCIALICKLVEMKIPGPFLICVPMSTISNWINEFKLFAPALPTILYHGSQDDRAKLRRYFTSKGTALDCYPVVVTTYEITIRDRVFLQKFEWHHLIVDEGHRLKNANCLLVKELKCLTVTAKVLLTGTPLQNNLKELWSLLNFIIPEVFDDLRVFESWFNIGNSNDTTEMSADQQYNFITMLHEILAPFLLRRIKSDVVLSLPPKKELIVHAPMSELQAEFYTMIVNKTIKSLRGSSKKQEKNDLQEMVAMGDLTNKHTTRSKTKVKRVEKENECAIDEDAEIHVNINNIMMLMRKCCNHPYLLKYPLIPGTEIYRIDEDLIKACGKFQLLDKMLPAMQKRHHRVLLFSQFTTMLTILEDYCNLRKYKYERLDGSTKCLDRQQMIKEFNSDPDIFIFLLSTKAGGLGINLTSADSVIIYDSDWNPQNDLQAQDRCHRIGQQKPVVVYRFVTSNTIDQVMVERAFEKRKLEKMVMHKDKFKGNLDVELREKKRVDSALIMQYLKDENIAEIHNKVMENSIESMTNHEFEELLCRDEEIPSNRWFKLLNQWH